MRPRGGGHNLVPRVSHRSREGSLGRTASGDGSKVPQPAHADVAAWCGDTVGPVEPSRRSPSLAVSGSVIGVVAVAALASVPRSPFQPVLPPGVAPGGPFAWLARALGLDRLDETALAIAGIVAVIVALGSFLWILREAWRGRVRLTTVVALAVAYHAVVMMLPLLFSRDVYSYAFYGRIASVYHANPYVQTPADFSHDALASLVGPK